MFFFTVPLPNGYKEIIIYPGQYKLRAYTFGDGQSYNPFAVKVSSMKDSTITYFAFADEYYYMYNSNSIAASWRSGKVEFANKTSADSTLARLINLEKNLNELITKLHYQKDIHAIRNLLITVFDNLLFMKPVDYYEVDELLSNLKRLNKEGKLDSAIREYTELRDNLYADSFCFHAKEGLDGYWILKLVKENESYKIHAKFIGDLLYFGAYL